MEKLQYVIEDSTIAELLGVQNFTNDESAVLELVKNAYDANASKVSLTFVGEKLVIEDTGVGMDEEDIRQHWMHIGKSDKDYVVYDENNRPRVLAGSKGVGRFALARLGKNVTVSTRKEGCVGIVWKTDWNKSTITFDTLHQNVGTVITIDNLRERWTKKKVQGLVQFLSKTYNDDAMIITVVHPDFVGDVKPYFPDPVLGKNCISTISINYDSENAKLSTHIRSDEFLDVASSLCGDVDIKQQDIEDTMVEELKVAAQELELSQEELKKMLRELGSFSGEFYFSIKPSREDAEKFLYKHLDLVESMPGGVILYRNAFGISSYEGKKDWLGFGKRSRKSPAAASHPTGAWRVRENQISGKVEIDKKRNMVLQDLSNRQGLDENIYYDLFVEIVLCGIKEFERYRQEIVRRINKKNEGEEAQKLTPISDKIASNPKSFSQLTEADVKQLISEIKSYKKENSDAKKEKSNVEKRYKYDVRILNVLATVGLKASSIAHEMRNDRNTIADNTIGIIEALKEFDMWDELQSPEKTEKAYKNVPYLLKANQTASTKLLTFMDVMLSEIEKRQFESRLQSAVKIIEKIKQNWEHDYAWISIVIDHEDEDIMFNISEDVLQVIFDNLILNSIQQNDSANHLNIVICAKQLGELIVFSYKDDGVGLSKKYENNPRKILEVHETTRPNGHGLGMWIVNNTVVMSGGDIESIDGGNGFFIKFTVGSEI